MAKPDKILAHELLDREVLDLTAGEVIGRIMDFALTSDGRVAQIGVLTTAWYEGGRGIAPEAIASVHRDRVCIEDSAALTEFAPDGEESFSLKGDSLIGKQVLQHDGELLGELTDFSFDLGEGRIGDLVVLGAEDKRNKVPVEKIRTIGRDFIVIDKGALGVEGAAEARPKPAEDKEPPADPKPAAKAAPEPAEPKAAEVEDAPEVPDELEATPPPPPAPAEDKAGIANDALFSDDKPAAELSKFDEKKRDYLLGRKAHRDIKTPAGEQLVAKGGKMNDEVVAKIIAAGMLSDVFIEMTLKK